MNEFLAYLDEYEDIIKEMEFKYNNLIKQMKNFPINYTNRKEFALSIKDCVFKDYLFKVLDGKENNPKEYLVKQKVENVVKLLGGV